MAAGGRCSGDTDDGARTEMRAVGFLLLTLSSEGPKSERLVTALQHLQQSAVF